MENKNQNWKNIPYYALPFPTTFRYVLSEEQKDYVDRNLAIFGDDAPGIGRLLSNAHTSKLLRTLFPLNQQKKWERLKFFKKLVLSCAHRLSLLENRFEKTVPFFQISFFAIMGVCMLFSY